MLPTGRPCRKIGCFGRRCRLSISNWCHCIIGYWSSMSFHWVSLLYFLVKKVDSQRSRVELLPELYQQSGQIVAARRGTRMMLHVYSITEADLVPKAGVRGTLIPTDNPGQITQRGNEISLSCRSRLETCKHARFCASRQRDWEKNIA